MRAITRNKMSSTCAVEDTTGNTRRCVVIFRLVETLMERILHCEILNNGVIMKHLKNDEMKERLLICQQLLMNW